MLNNQELAYLLQRIDTKLNLILANQSQESKQMATISADVQDALTAIQQEVTDVATLLQTVVNSGVSPQLQSQLEQAIASLQQSDQSIQAVINPAPTPTPTPAPPSGS